MPTKCTARKVSEAMDEIEAELDKARPFIEKAIAKARKIRGLPHLPKLYR